MSDRSYDGAWFLGQAAFWKSQRSRRIGTGWCLAWTALGVCFFIPARCHADDQKLAKTKPMLVQGIEDNSIAIGGVETKGTVLVVISTDCPIANSYQPELQRLRKELVESGLQFLMVHGSPSLSKQDAREHARQFGIEWMVILDPDQVIVRHLEATVIPSAFLVDQQGQIVYRGRIDDRHVALGRKKRVASRQDLRLAIQQFLAGDPIEVSETESVGCRVKY